MRYEGQVFRPPSEGRSYIVQATIGCSHNLCTYCAMYRDKQFRIRALDETLEDIRVAGAQAGNRIEKLFIADGDALVLPMDHWRPILETARQSFPKLRQVSAYAMAHNILDKSDDDLCELRELGLNLLYIGPESGHDPTLKRLVKGATHQEHILAAQRAHAAGMKISVIILLGAGGQKYTQEHAQCSAQLVTGMDPEYISALTLTVVPNTPLHRMQEKGRFHLPDVQGLLQELRILVAESNPTSALFRTNHASNYLPIGGVLPDDRADILRVIDHALSGGVRLRPEWARGL